MTTSPGSASALPAQESLPSSILTSCSPPKACAGSRVPGIVLSVPTVPAAASVLSPQISEYQFSSQPVSECWTGLIKLSGITDWTHKSFIIQRRTTENSHLSHAFIQPPQSMFLHYFSRWKIHCSQHHWRGKAFSIQDHYRHNKGNFDVQLCHPSWLLMDDACTCTSDKASMLINFIFTQTASYAGSDCEPKPWVSWHWEGTECWCQVLSAKRKEQLKGFKQMRVVTPALSLRLTSYTTCIFPVLLLFRTGYRQQYCQSIVPKGPVEGASTHSSHLTSPSICYCSNSLLIWMMFLMSTALLSILAAVQQGSKQLSKWPL